MSLKDLRSKSNEALASMPAGKPLPEGRVARPVTAPGATAFMQPTIDALNQRAKEAEAKVLDYERRLDQQPTEVALDQLVEVGSRKRRLTDEQFEELKANLAINSLVHPIAVRRREDGRLEVVSGHNRIAAYRALGRSTIAVVVVDIEEGKVDLRDELQRGLLLRAHHGGSHGGGALDGQTHHAVLFGLDGVDLDRCRAVAQQHPGHDGNAQARLDHGNVRLVVDDMAAALR